MRTHWLKIRPQREKMLDSALNVPCLAEDVNPSEDDQILDPCPTWEELLSKMHPNDLSTEDRLRLEKHLEECSKCAEVRRRDRVLYSLIREMPLRDQQVLEESNELPPIILRALIVTTDIDDVQGQWSRDTEDPHGEVLENAASEHIIQDAEIKEPHLVSLQVKGDRKKRYLSIVSLCILIGVCIGAMYFVVQEPSLLHFGWVLLNKSFVIGFLLTIPLLMIAFIAGYVIRNFSKGKKASRETHK